ncbi:hypothetical protein PoB_000697800 [Plakobranchus ocellatus]|uniref:SMB domain-containing protein n=1 Tax=Plakobranchus ocellatus TaxID=259542 RepID=A0AAV3YDE7_9GAST|nr:hypothetical protein PoB_000697800 [Plakobranchus ocellatus]
MAKKTGFIPASLSWLYICVFVPLLSEAADYSPPWSYHTEHWEDFHIRHCGMVCDKGSLFHLYKNICTWPKCFQCDCHSSCSLLDTCCPQRSVLPDGSFVKKEKKASFSDSLPSSPEHMTCTTVPYSSSTYLQVVSCPSRGMNANYVHINSETKKTLPNIDSNELCTRNMNNETNFSFFVPYVDIHSGLVFKNKFCALCNGYLLGSTETLSDSYRNKTVLPWQLVVKCSHYQLLFMFVSQKKFVDAAAADYRQCSVSYKKAPTNRQPRSCFPNAPKDYDKSTCEEPTRSLCHKLNNTYLSLSGYKNIFCFICQGLEPKHQNCMETFITSAQVEIMSRGFRKDPPPPLSLLLGVSKYKITQEDKQLECNGSNEWMDDNVSTKESYRERLLVF